MTEGHIHIEEKFLHSLSIYFSEDIILSLIAIQIIFNIINYSTLFMFLPQ